MPGCGPRKIQDCNVALKLDANWSTNAPYTATRGPGRSIERPTGGRATKAAAILDFPVVDATSPFNLNPQIWPVK